MKYCQQVGHPRTQKSHLVNWIIFATLSLQLISHPINAEVLESIPVVPASNSGLYQSLNSITNISNNSNTFRGECINSYLTKSKYGPHYFIRSDALSAHSITKRSIESIETLKIIGQNFENLGSFIERVKEKIIKPDGSVEIKLVDKIVEKTKEQKESLARRIKLMNPDLIIGTELKDIQSAIDYNRDYLDDQFLPILVEGNDSRGIDVCIFIKKDLPFNLEVQSHKNIAKSETELDPIFSRDFPVVYFRAPNSSINETPLFALFGTHYKSQMNDTPENPVSSIKREKQVNASMMVINEIQTRFPQMPFLIGGDFNNDVRLDSSFEFKRFFSAGFKDSMDIAPDAPPKDSRGTHYFFSNENNHKATTPGNLHMEQLDMLLGNKAIFPFILSAGIQRDIDVNGNPTPLPKNPNDVDLRASDHDGIFVVINFKSLFAKSKK